MGDFTANPHSRILIVEDDELVRLVGVGLLEDAGYEVIEAETADHAIAVLENATNVELLFTDVDMPGSMNGMELAALVHRRWPKIKLLVTSGKHEILNSDLPDHGHFMPKPYSSATIVRELDDLLKKS